MKGSTFKRCKCRDADDKELGSSCPKLKRSDGAWNPRHGSWYYRLELDRGPDGKRNTVRRGGYADQTEAEHELEAAKDKAKLGVDVTARVTTGSFLESWLTDKKKTIAPKTYVSYAGHIRNYLIPAFGAVELDRLRAAHAEEMFAGIEERNEAITAARASSDPKVRATVKGQRTVGASSQQRIRATLRSALTDARRQNLVSVNIATLVKLASGKRPKALVWTPEREKRWRQSGHKPSPVMVWMPGHAAKFLAQARNHRLFPLFRLVLVRGLRRGEAAGLPWSETRLDDAQIDVRYQRVEVDWQVLVTVPKSDAGERTVALDTETVSELRRWRRRQAAEKLRVGTAWVETGLVFTREDGSGWHPATIADIFQHLLRAADLPPIRFHDTRHVAASLMRAGGQDISEIQNTLGHSSSVLTRDTYTSVFPEAAQDGAEATASVIPAMPDQDEMDRGETA